MAAAGQQTAVHSLMRLQEYGGVVVLQPYGEAGPQGQSLACDLQTGKLMFADNVDKMQTGFTTIYGIMGIAKLQTGSVLVAVTGARKVQLICIYLVIIALPCLHVGTCSSIHCYFYQHMCSFPIMQVATLRGHHVYQVTDTMMYGKHHLNSKEDDK